jgi:hypothetical protein
VVLEMASGIFFNWAGRTYELELVIYDKPTVWRGLIDGEHEVFFEAATDVDGLTLIELAIEAWMKEFEKNADI